MTSTKAAGLRMEALSAAAILRAVEHGSTFTLNGAAGRCRGACLPHELL
jgi:hypothetical protein